MVSPAMLPPATRFLLLSTVVAQEFQPGGSANGRALAYLAHRYNGIAAICLAVRGSGEVLRRAEPDRSHCPHVHVG